MTVPEVEPATTTDRRYQALDVSSAAGPIEIASAYQRYYLLSTTGASQVDESARSEAKLALRRAAAAFDSLVNGRHTGAMRLGLLPPGDLLPDGTLRAVIDGEPVVIPLDPANAYVPAHKDRFAWTPQPVTTVPTEQEQERAPQLEGTKGQLQPQAGAAPVPVPVPAGQGVARGDDRASEIEPREALQDARALLDQQVQQELALEQQRLVEAGQSYIRIEVPADASPEERTIYSAAQSLLNELPQDSLVVSHTDVGQTIEALDPRHPRNLQALREATLRQLSRARSPHAKPSLQVLANDPDAMTMMRSALIAAAAAYATTHDLASKDDLNEALTQNLVSVGHHHAVGRSAPGIAHTMARSLR